MKFFIIFGLFLGIYTVSALTTKDDTHVGRVLSFESVSTLTCFFEPLESEMFLTIAMRPTFDSGYQMQFRVTSPSGEWSEWASGDGDAYMEHNTTENGAYEICLYTRRPMRVNMFLQFYNPEKAKKSLDSFIEANHLSKSIQESIMETTNRIYKIYYTLKFQNQMVVRDEALQVKNGDYIMHYSQVFSVFAVIIALFQVYFVRKMFNVDTTKIRI
ncbi:unnamed protein product [Caenorhabditis angaria]|uniref:GOLD domain-containing protein n=1 Tax=Caenorhabditis angaria TaxID=860376 RepID=A0A9P1MUN3_9PELO|nr:unnamed protein product [Caenorhabditis angaria]